MPIVRPLRILLATYWHLPHVGGVSNFMDLLAQELRARGHHVDTIGHTENMLGIYMLETGLYVEKKPIKDYVYETMLSFFDTQIPLVDPWIRWREIERYTYELACLLLGVHNYDVIHTQDIVSTRAISRVKSRNSAHVATIHGLLLTEYLASGEIKSRSSMPFAYAKAEEYFGSTSADVTMVPADWLRQRMSEECGVPRDRLRVVPYGLDVEKFLLATRHWPENVPRLRGRFMILCPARFVAVKGHRVLLEAVHKLKKEFRLTVWLAGEGDLRGELEAYSAELGLEDNVVFLGARDDVPALIRMADVVVLPSLQDTLPFTVMESQVAGVPLVASRVGGIPEMIEDGRTGLLASPGNPEDLAAKLGSLLRDDRRRKELGETARKFGRTAWASGPLVDRILGAYEEALRKKGGRA